jgi:hypothetical protein
MNLSFPVYRRLLFVYVAVIVVVALVIALGVIGPVKEDVYRNATPEIAVKAFWFNIGFNLFMAAVLVLIAIPAKGRSGISTAAHIVVGFIVTILGLILIDAASAYRVHGPAMQTASILLFICAAADILVGVLVFITAFLQPRKS